jgi:uncharacterized protein
MITRHHFLTFCATAILALCSHSATAAEKIPVLLIDGQNNHKWQETTPVLVKALNASGRFEVTVSTTPAKEALPVAWETWRPDFSKYKVVISNYNGVDWPPTVKLAFEKFVREGGGFVCIHAADNAFPKWNEYNQMIGLGGWGGRNEKSGPYVYLENGQVKRDLSPGPGGNHGPQHEFLVELTTEGKAHPITKGMPDVWKHAKDELYDKLRGPAEKMTILATAMSQVTNRQEPMAMVIDYHQGRCFHLALGHADYSMKDVGFWVLLQRGTEWAATKAVTIPLPAQMPTKDAILVTP